MFHPLGLSDMQAANNLFGGCISAWQKEDFCVSCFPEEYAPYIP